MSHDIPSVLDDGPPPPYPLLRARPTAKKLYPISSRAMGKNDRATILTFEVPPGATARIHAMHASAPSPCEFSLVLGTGEALAPILYTNDFQPNARWDFPHPRVVRALETAAVYVCVVAYAPPRDQGLLTASVQLDIELEPSLPQEATP